MESSSRCSEAEPTLIFVGIFVGAAHTVRQSQTGRTRCYRRYIYRFAAHCAWSTVTVISVRKRNIQTQTEYTSSTPWRPAVISHLSTESSSSVGPMKTLCSSSDLSARKTARPRPPAGPPTPMTAPSAAQTRGGPVCGARPAAPRRPTEPPPSQNMDIVFLYPPPDAYRRGCGRGLADGA